MTTALNGSVRFVDLQAQIRSLQPALTEAVQAVLDRGDFILGKDVELFEQEFAAYCGVPTFTIFGPQLPEWFAPLHPEGEWLEGKPCPYKPCSDYCRFAEPLCLSRVTDEEVWIRVEWFLNAQAITRAAA